MVEKIQIEKIRTIRENFTKFHEKMVTAFGEDQVIYDLMALRKYKTQAMFDTLKSMGVFRAYNLSDIKLLLPEFSNQQLKEFGLVTEHGDYLLAGRYVLPIRDIQGKVIAMVGWSEYGGPKKYITTSTVGFSRDASFFNYDCYRLSHEKYGGLVYLVEGIFDTISLKSIGLPVIGNQGLEMSSIKKEMLKRFKKVVAIPDNDRAGMSVNPYLNKISGKDRKFSWDIEIDNVFVSLMTGVKDCDDLVREFDAYDDLIQASKAKYTYRIKEE